MRLSDARIVVVGGGAVGAGVAYSLAREGHTDVLVIEKEAGLGAVTTGQAAGLVGQVRGDVERIRLARWSVEVFSELQRNPEINPGWRQTGSLRVATDPVRVEAFRHLLAQAGKAGLELHLIGPDEARRHWPQMDFGKAVAILWCPSDGYLQPTDLATTYQHHARAMGVRFATGTRVEAITVENGRVTGVRTDRGDVACEYVINAAGAHAYHVARLAGLELPIVPVRHEMFVTVAAQGVRPGMPVVRAVDQTTYIRPEVEAVLVGGWEPGALSADPRTYGLGDPTPPIEADWPVLGEFAEQSARLYPELTELGVRAVFKGWPTFTPDGRFVVGESSAVGGFVMAGGCNAHGVSGSAGIGRYVVEAMFEKDPSPYVRSLSPDRFAAGRWNWPAAMAAARKLYETYYAPS